jgi:hypothetical protein
MKKETDSKGASEADIPCTSKTNSWKGRAANSKRKIQIEKVPLETYDFNKVTILGEKHRNKSLLIQTHLTQLLLEKEWSNLFLRLVLMMTFPSEGYPCGN